MIDQQTLPTLQSAVDALFGRVTAGRGDRSNGTAIVSGLTGRIDNLTEDETAILGDAMGSKYGDHHLETWSRDELHAAGASEADWDLEKEFAYQAQRRGLEGETLKLTVERIMRAGPYRSKWDEPRNKTTWLAQDVANAVATVLERVKKYQTGPSFDWDEEIASEAPAADETPEQKLARMERENAQLRSVNAVQMTNLRTERAQRQALAETVRAMFDVLAIPDEQMSARTKLVYLFSGREATSRNSRGIANLPNIAIAEGTGLTEKIVSEIMQDIAARDGSPIERRVTREWETDEEGNSRPKSVAQVAITTLERSYVSVLRAAPAMGGPSDKMERKKAEARARAAASVADRIEARAASWGHCSSHDNDLVAVKGYCPETDCGEIVGERVVRVEEFALLNPEMRDSGESSAPVRDTVTKHAEMRDSDQHPLIDFVAATARPPEEHPIFAAVERMRAKVGTHPPVRCECGCYEFKPLPGGVQHQCLKCAVVYGRPLGAVAGGQE